MRIRVKLFAVAKQVAGTDSVELELDEGADIAQLRLQLASQVPQLSGLLSQMTFALGTQYAGEKARIPPGAEVACIPPVSGG